ncbi:LuxR family transcriptional regulator [Streptomyces sp. MNP-20]|uniref:LuxR family transcriptional regulator n=1 Tax=Streptomyces sp. MNP-20 TaxID=2721165 RepID=UPI001552D654|nr:LuxR family transcriptional regulator [Streptomyces sp. MNP-20]
MPTLPQQRSTSLLGRRDELREIEAALGRAGAGGEFLVVHGDPGTGKSTLVKEALRSATRTGLEALVIRLRPATYGDLGLDALVDQVCDTLVEETDNGTLSLVTAVRRKQAQTARDRQHYLPLMLETQRAVREAADRRAVVVLFDNAHLVAFRDLGALGALLYGLRSDGACVVVSGWMPMGRPGAVGALAAAADRVIDLGPLTPAQTAELAGQRLGLPGAPELMAALQRDLGRLVGNPRAVLLALDALREQRRLAVVDGRACLVDPDAVVPLPGFHTELRRVWQPVGEHAPGGADETFPGEVLALLTRMTRVAETTMDDFLDLAGELGSTQEHVGRVLDDLVALRLVAVDDRQRLQCAVPAVGAELLTFRTERETARLHARVVLNARRRAGGDAKGLAPRLADHVFAAGAALADGVSKGVLLTAARCGGPDETVRAKRASLALLRQLPLTDERLPEILRTAISLMLHHGDADGLLELGDHLLPRLGVRASGAREVIADLASAWALAALHNQWLGNRVVDGDAPPARAALRVPAAAALLTLAGRLRGGCALAQAASPEPTGPDRPAQGGPIAYLSTGRVPSERETRLLIGALGTRSEFTAAAAGGPRLRTAEGPVPADPDELRAALAIGDWATSWEMVLGDSGVRFLDSPLHTYQAMVREYVTGSWDVALRLARTLVSGPEATHQGPLYVYSRSIASDICCWQGDMTRAEAWLAHVADGTDHGALPCWAFLGLRHGRGDLTAGRWQGWRDYRALRAKGQVIGLERLLLRMLVYAADAHDDRAALDALDALEELDVTVGSRLSRATMLLGRAFARGHVPSALEAYGPLVRYGGREAAFAASLWLLRATGGEEWLLEAWKWSEAMVSRRARKQLVDLAQELRLPLPRRRGERPAFSRLELKVIKMVAEGWTNRQISVALARSEKSVEAYLAKIFESTGCRTRVELAKAWLDGGLTSSVPA